MSLPRIVSLTVLVNFLVPYAVSGADDAQLALEARSVLKQYCHRCHNGPGSEGGEGDFLLRAQMLRVDSAGQTLVTPGDPAKSSLFDRIVQVEMPPGGQPQPRPQDVAVLWNWIKAGVPDFPDSPGRGRIPLTEVLTQLRDHVRAAPREQRPYLRYFTLHHLHNNPAVSPDELRLTRAALSKAINSLSHKPRIVVPKALNTEHTLFAIDVRDLDWDRDDLWTEILRHYPYGVKYGNHPDETLRLLDEELCDLTGCALPLIRADWFVAKATRPPLYHTLLRIPEDAGELERRLRVDIAGSYRSPTPERIARAGFAKSGVSGQNRLVERNESRGGFYWKSYDFKADSPRSTLTRFPLGPVNLFPAGRHPFSEQAFIHDGGEIIFSLPNGLQGYMLIDGNDQRIDAGPIEVVSDALKTSGTPAIVNGVSCMACHKAGMIDFTDTLREHSAVFGDAEKQVRMLYPPQARMDELLAVDRQRFLAALEQAVGPFLREGADRDRPLAELPEPVGDIARAYALGYLDLQTIACELDVADPQVMLLQAGEKRLKQLGLEALLRQKGTISRFEWETINGLSLMQELGRAMRYTPWRPL